MHPLRPALIRFIFVNQEEGRLVDERIAAWRFRPHPLVAGVPAKVVGYAGCTEPARAMDHNVEPVAAPEDKG